jgi:hypothetical protein
MRTRSAPSVSAAACRWVAGDWDESNVAADSMCPMSADDGPGVVAPTTPVSLFGYQSIPQGGWARLDGAVRALYLILRVSVWLGAAGESLVVGSQIGFQLGCPGPVSR